MTDSNQHSSATEMLKLLHKKWPEAVVIVNAEIRRLEEQLSAYEDEINELTSDQALTLRKLHEEQERADGLLEQFDALFRAAHHFVMHSESDVAFDALVDALPAGVPNPAKRRLTPEAEQQWREMVDPYLEPDPASERHEHTWTHGASAGIYRCMTCGAEATELTGRFTFMVNDESRPDA